jgi:hypothetical protein
MEAPRRVDELQRFDKLRKRQVYLEQSETVATFLAKFQATAAGLEVDERIALLLQTQYENNIEYLKAVLGTEHANKICSLKWFYFGNQDVPAVAELIARNCTELESLDVHFTDFPATDFASSVLEHPNTKLKVLQVLPGKLGEFPRFFAALAQSQVARLGVADGCMPDFYPHLRGYLERDLLVSLDIYVEDQAELMSALAKCTRLNELMFDRCNIYQPTALACLPKSIVKLAFSRCYFTNKLDWSFLVESNLQEVHLNYETGIDGTRLGLALAAHAQAKGLRKLLMVYSDCADQVAVAMNAELAQVERLMLSVLRLATSIEQISLALQSPRNRLRELDLELGGDTMAAVETHLLPALRHSNCALTTLELFSWTPEHKQMIDKINGDFSTRLEVLVLLSGQQVTRLRCPLRRLPVEMLRLVGGMLM